MISHLAISQSSKRLGLVGDWRNNQSRTQCLRSFVEGSVQALGKGGEFCTEISTFGTSPPRDLHANMTAAKEVDDIVAQLNEFTTLLLQRPCFCMILNNMRLYSFSESLF